MSKTITIEDANGGEKYVLEYSRKTVKEMERRGFVAGDVFDKPVTGIPELFAGAFMMHHRWVKRDVIDRLYDQLSNRDELIGVLAEMYNEPLEALIKDSDNSKGNVSWTAN